MVQKSSLKYFGKRKLGAIPTHKARGSAERKFEYVQRVRQVGLVKRQGKSNKNETSRVRAEVKVNVEMVKVVQQE